jgi:hypothetical protein
MSQISQDDADFLTSERIANSDSDFLEADSSTVGEFKLVGTLQQLNNIVSAQPAIKEFLNDLYENNSLPKILEMSVCKEDVNGIVTEIVVEFPIKDYKPL